MSTDKITINKPKRFMVVPNPFTNSTPTKATKNNNHCIDFIFSFKKISAKIAAKIGEVYLKETAVPTSK